MTPRHLIRKDGKWVEVTAEEFASARSASSVFQKKGLGDLVHSIAHPIAKAIDTVAGTNLANCGSCAERRETLNNIGRTRDT